MRKDYVQVQCRVHVLYTKGVYQGGREETVENKYENPYFFGSFHNFLVKINYF